MPPDQDKQSKTEKASPHKLRKSRGEGQVAKSQDLSGSVALAIGMVMFIVLLPQISNSIADLIKKYLLDVDFRKVVDFGFNAIIIDVFKEFSFIVIPFLAAIWLAAFVTTLAQVGFHVSTKPLEPKLDKINPLQGLQKIFSKRGLINTLLSVGKMIIIASVAGTVLWSDNHTHTLIHMDNISGVLNKSAMMIIEITSKACFVLIVMSILDYVYQKYQFLEDQKMTKDEVKREHKEQEGSPEIKSKVRSLQRATAQKRGLREAVKTADVVIVNPFHIAVAIQYDRERGTTAPIVVAKGARLLAERIKKFAREAGIEIIQNIPLARSLYKQVKSGLEIPPELYVAVAEVLAIVFKKRDKTLNPKASF
jgi:flagellar biosynthesis protein FlhB